MKLTTALPILLALAACQGSPAEADRADPRDEVRVIRLAHADAAELAGLLDASFGPGDAVRYTADARTNSLLVSGSEEGLARLLDTVALLDVPAEG